MPRVDSCEIDRWRSMDATVALQALADHAKRDLTFEPIKDKRTSRWHASVRDRQFELLLTGPKFFDTRAEVGGGGAIDLAIHLWGFSFKMATDALRKRRL